MLNEFKISRTDAIANRSKLVDDVKSTNVKFTLPNSFRSAHLVFLQHNL